MKSYLLSPISRVFYFGILFLISYTIFPSEASAAVLSKAPNNLGLVGFWPMNEGTGTKVGDMSGSGNTGTLIAGSTWTTGKYGKAVNFDGSTGYILLSSSLNLTGEMTTSAWIRTDTVTVGTRAIIANTSSDGNIVPFSFEINRTAARLGFVHGDSGGGEYLIGAANTNLKANTWYHVVAVRTGSGVSWTVTFYVNGVNDGAPSTTTADPGSNQTTAIGRCGTICEQYFNGQIDEVRIYNRALSATEVAKLYRAGAVKVSASSADLDNGSTLENGLVGLWTLDGKDISGTNVYDRSPVGTNTGTNSGATKTIGKIGQGLRFDGVDDVVNVTDPGTDSILDFSSGESITISAWVKYNETADYLEIFGKGNSVNTNYGVELDPPSGGKRYPIFYFHNIAWNYFYPTTRTLEPNQWIHIAVTHTFGSTVNSKWYINGQSVPISTTNDITRDPPVNNSVLNIGDTPNGATLNGSLDEVRIYSRALLASEIKQLYNLGGDKINTSPTTKLTSGLVGYWTFDGKDISGTNVYDRSPVGTNTGTNNGATKTIGKIGQGLRFDGINDYIVDTNVVNTDVVTISAWVNLQSYPTSGFTFLVGFVDGLNSATNDKILRINTAGAADFYAYAGGVHDTSDTSALSLNTWYHLVGVANGSNLYIYLNGIQAGSDAAGSTFAGYTVPNIFIGGVAGSNATNYANAKIDDVRIYNRALSASEVKQLYNLGR